MSAVARARLDNAAILAAGLGAALLAGLLIGRGSYTLPLGLAAATLVVLVGMRGGLAPLTMLIVAVFIQIPIGTLGPIAELRVIEVLVPLLLLALLLGTTLGVAPMERARAEAVRSPARALHVAVGIYAAVLALNWLRSAYVLETDASIGRPFYAYFVALGTYVLVWFALAHGRVTFRSFLQLLYWISLVMCAIGLAAVLLGLPLNLGGVRYAVALSGEDEAVRVGFLEIFGAIGLALVAVRAAPSALVSGALFGGAMLASGGRSATLGIVVGLLVFLLAAREWLPLLATAFALLLIIAFAPPSLQSNPQIERLTTFNQEIAQRNSRSFFYEESIKAFRKQPLEGTGLGRPAAVYTRSPRLAEFLTQQLEFGGHATYHSLLKNFGLLGFLPFVAALLLAILRLGRLIRRNQLAGFLFIMLISQAIALIPAGNGSDPIYFLLLGAAAAVLAASRRTPEYRSTTAGTE